MSLMSSVSSRLSRPWSRIACTAGLAAVLGLTGAFGPFVSVAHAATAETTVELDRLTEQVAQAQATHSDAIARATELNDQIAQQADEILHLEQDVMPVYRERAAEAASRLYKMHETSGNIISLLFSASSFSDFITQMKYLNAIQDDNASVLADLEEASAELNAKMAELTQAKDDALSEGQKAADALDQVSAAQAALEERAASEDAAEAEAARKAADEAAAIQAQMQHQYEQTSAATESADDAISQQPEQDPAQDASESETPQESEPAPETPQDSSSDSESGWMTGVASHYGTGDGLMGSLTASGEPVTETSMCIAMLDVPLGTKVEIRYGGKTVVACVNDRGPYAHGRVIDMQPAVARALDFISVGVGTVEYRIL